VSRVVAAMGEQSAQAWDARAGACARVCVCACVLVRETWLQCCARAPVILALQHSPPFVCHPLALTHTHTRACTRMHTDRHYSPSQPPKRTHTCIVLDCQEQPPWGGPALTHGRDSIAAGCAGKSGLLGGEVSMGGDSAQAFLWPQDYGGGGGGGLGSSTISMLGRQGSSLIGLIGQVLENVRYARVRVCIGMCVCVSVGVGMGFQECMQVWVWVRLVRRLCNC